MILCTVDIMFNRIGTMLNKIWLNYVIQQHYTQVSLYRPSKGFHLERKVCYTCASDKIQTKYPLSHKSCTPLHDRRLQLQNALCTITPSLSRLLDDR